MAESNMFKPNVSSAGLGEKKKDGGQFSNPPAYPEVSGFSGSQSIGSKSTIMNVEKSPTARKGRV